MVGYIGEERRGGEVKGDFQLEQIKIRQKIERFSNLPTLNFFGILAETRVFF